jgi:hypothetical protein
VDYDGGAVGQQRVRPIFEGGIIVFEMGARFAIGFDGKVPHVAGVVAIGIIKTMLIAIGIEVSTRRLEVGAFALGDLMEVDRVLSGREIVEFELEGNAWSLIPQDDIADVFALSVFEFDFSFGRAPGWEGSQREEQYEGERDKALHGFGASWQQKL